MSVQYQRRFAMIIFLMLPFLFAGCTLYRNTGRDNYDNQAPALIAKATGQAVVQRPANRTNRASSSHAHILAASCDPYLTSSAAERVLANPELKLQLEILPDHRSLGCKISTGQRLLARCLISGHPWSISDDAIGIANNIDLHQQAAVLAHLGDWNQIYYADMATKNGQNLITLYLTGFWQNQREPVRCEFHFTSVQNWREHRAKVLIEAESLVKIISAKL